MSYLNDPRVLFAAERTLLAWNRTAIALITLGFVIERFGLFIKIMHINMVPGQRELSFWLGLSLIAGSVVVNSLSIWQFLRVRKSLSPEEIPDRYMTWLAASLNLLVALFGGGLIFYLARGFL